MTGAKTLSFKDVDALGFAAVAPDSDLEQAPAAFVPNALGPLLELLHLESAGRLPRHPQGGSWLTLNGAAAMVSALRENRELWVNPRDRRMGFIRTKRSEPNADSSLVSFLMNAQTAARNISGLPGTVPRQLAAAMEELENNIHEHSEAVDTGLLAFRAAVGVFEFAAADRGIGILESLKGCPTYVALPDSGKALEAALTDGTSRFGANSQRGNGFRPIFLGLANLRGTLRFRSGDHALIIDGTSPKLAMAQLLQKPAIDGFFASIRCHA